MDNQFIKPLLAAITAGVLLALAVILTLAPKQAQAADLGGSCCSELEDRIAELEATTARKGNRKVSLTISGQINAGVLYLDAGDYDQTQVIQSGTDESFVSFRGAGRISPDLTAGYVLEITTRQLGLLDSGIGGDPGLQVRQSYAYLKSESLGGVSIGQQGQATNDFDKVTTANTAVATKPLSLQPISDIYLTGLDLPFDGNYRNLIRYSSPVWGGFSVSGSYGNALDGTATDGDGSTYDVAARYAGEQAGFGIAAAAGWRHDEDMRINVLDVISVTVPTGDVETLSAVLSVKHMTSGIFATVNWADQDWKDSGALDLKLKAWQATAGWENRLNTFGKTTIYGEYGVTTVETSVFDDVDIDLYGAGIVQAFDNAGLDLYLAYKQYDLGDIADDTDVKTVIGGARVKF